MRFSLGQIVATPGALETFAPAFIRRSLQRHSRGDWGDISTEDRGLNESDLVHGGRLLSVYTDERGKKLWIITEADRSSTCCLMPEEY